MPTPPWCSTMWGWDPAAADQAASCALSVSLTPAARICSSADLSDPPRSMARIGDAEIGGETGHRQARDRPLIEIAAEAGRRDAVVLEEGRIAVDRGAESLADDQLRLGPDQLAVELGAGRALHAMVGPQRLLAIGHRDVGEGGTPLVAGGEAGMTPRVPILRQHHMIESLDQPVDRPDDLVPLRHRQRTAGAEIVLDVDDDQGRTAHGALPG
jgi:hypothetical protein